MDIFTMLLSLLIIIGLIVGATIRINTLMTGKIINLLLNKKLLLVIASILALLLTLAFFMVPLAHYWDEYFWLAYFIAVIFLVANSIPTVVTYLKEIHQNNLEDIKEQELKEV